MTKLTDQGLLILKQALALQEEERALLVMELAATLQDAEELPSEELSAEQNEELRRRLDDIVHGRAKLIPWSEAREQISAKLRTARTDQRG